MKDILYRKNSAIKQIRIKRRMLNGGVQTEKVTPLQSPKQNYELP